MKNPQLGPHDLHIVISGTENTAKIYNATGTMLRQYPCLPHGVGGRDWRVHAGDTPPGLYLAGDVVKTLPGDPQADAYGPYFIYLIEQEAQESSNGRAGCGMHGGRQAGRENPQLMETEGCVRFFDGDIEKIVNTVEWTHKIGGKVWITVIQAAPSA